MVNNEGNDIAPGSEGDSTKRGKSSNKFPPQEDITKAFKIIEKVRQELIDNEEYEEVIALDAYMKYIKGLLYK
jgi:hypothetical protein